MMKKLPLQGGALNQHVPARLRMRHHQNVETKGATVTTICSRKKSVNVSQ